MDGWDLIWEAHWRKSAGDGGGARTSTAAVLRRSPVSAK
jgi:hypothetical protein